MSAVKRLWAICISLGIVILTAFPSALLVDAGEWYDALILPPYALPSTAYTPVWAAIYLADTAALTLLFYKGAEGLKLWLPLSAGVLNVFWCYMFFGIKSIPAGAVVLGIMTVYTAACGIADFRKYRISSLIFLFKAVFFGYLFAVVLAIK